MREWRLGATAIALGSVLVLGLSTPAFAASATPNKQGGKAGATASRSASHATSQGAATVNALRGKPAFTGHASAAPLGRAAYVSYGAFAPRGKNALRGRQAFARGYGMSCVPYARAATGISVAGNAWQWWDNAAGQYSRGYMPEAGSVLAFRSNLRMPMGHVAVVSHVVNGRQIVIDHANWPTSGGRGGIAQGVTVVDVSDRNDWSAVRVELGRSGDYGSVYPTHGFIYNRPDSGIVRTATRAPQPQLALNPAPRDLRQGGYRAGRDQYNEVAEAPITRDTLIQPRANNWLYSTQPYSFGN